MCRNPAFDAGLIDVSSVRQDSSEMTCLDALVHENYPLEMDEK